MTAPTIEVELEQPARIVLPCADWDTPCPMTGKNECPSDPKEQAKCPQC